MHVKPFASLILFSALTAVPLHAQEEFIEMPSLETMTATGQCPTFSKQFRLGRLLEGSRVTAVVEYPEYQALTSAQVRELKRLGMVQAQSEVHPRLVTGEVRGEQVADVTFSPVVRRGGRWYMLTSCKLSVKSSDSVLPGAFRRVALATQQAAAAGRYASESVLKQGKWVKIRVSAEGIYQLTDSRLRQWGFSDPSRVKLYGYGGRPLEEKMAFTGRDAVIDDLCEVPLYRRSGSSLFFAEGVTRWNSDGSHLQSPYSSYSCYFLTEGDAPAEFQTLEDHADVPVTVNAAEAHALVDRDGYCWYEGGRDFYESEQVGSSKQYTLQLPGFRPDLASDGTGKQKVTVRWDIANSSSTNAATVSLTDRATGTVMARGTISASTADGVSACGYRSSVLTDVFDSQTARLQVESTDPSARLNYISIAYLQQLSASNPVAAFSPERAGRVKLVVEDAKSTTRVWQLQSGNAQAAELPSSLSGSTLTAVAPDGAQRFVIVDTEATYDSPELVGSVDNQNLHADAGIRYVIIVPTSGKLDAQAERLAEAHRQKEGMTVKVVHADEIYNEFSSGTPDASAYRRYLKMLYDRAQTEAERPAYVLFFGDCAWDNRGVTAEWRNLPKDDFLLSYERLESRQAQARNYSIGTLYSYVTDDYFGLLDDSEAASIETERVDLGIGRFPCHDEQTARLLVDRTLKYMNNGSVGAWKNNAFFIADYGDENLHMQDADNVFSQARTSAGNDFMLRHLYVDSYKAVQTAKGLTYPQATERLQQFMQQGALIFNYNGHGSPDRLSHGFLIMKEDMTANASQALPLWIYASCEISPYDQQIEDLARNSLYNKEGGSVAVLCAARSVYSNYNRAIDKGFVKYLFTKNAEGNRLTFGDALMRTKAELISGTSTIGSDYSMNKLKYVLLGDPALHLAYADSGVEVDSIDGQQLTDGALRNLSTGRVVRISGKVGEGKDADESFDGVLTATLYGTEETIVCNGRGNSSADEHTFSDFTRTLYQGSVNVTKGRFDLDLVIPRGVNFSQNAALLSLYAVSADSTREYKGVERRFCINSAAQTEDTDSIGPKVYVYLDRPDFPDGGVVDVNSTFYATLQDSSGISVASGALGHNMELVVDDDQDNVVTLNDYFQFQFGSYQEGSVSYPLRGLAPGLHTLKFRAWDVCDNSTTATLRFTVAEGGGSDFDVVASDATPRTSTRFITSFIRQAEGSVDVTTEVYSLDGIRVWSSVRSVESGEYAAVDWNLTDAAGRRLMPGVYLYRSVVNGKSTKTKKLVML